MTCKNDPNDVNNALHKPDGESKATYTVEYGPYMNWGRWNHNPSRIMSLVDTLKGGGVSVQLKHDDKETTWESHGWIKVYDDKNALLLEHDDIQHNRKYGGDLGEKLGKELLDKVGKEPEKKEKEGGVLDKIVAACSPKDQTEATDKAAEAEEGEGDKAKEEEKVEEKVEEKAEAEAAA